MALLALALSAGGTAGGQETAPTQAGTAPLTLEGVIREVREKNPEIAAARARWEAAEARAPMLSTPDNPMVGVERQPLSDEWMYSVTQTLPYPGKLLLRGRMADHEALTLRAEYRDREREVLARTSAAYARYYVADREHAALREQEELLHGVVRAAQARYASGQRPQSDALRAQVELEKVMNRTEIAAEEREAAQAALNALMARTTDTDLGAPEDPVPEGRLKPLPDLQALAQRFRPALAARVHERQHAVIGQDLAGLGWVPDFGFKVQRRVMTGVGSATDWMATATVPLWFWSPRAGVRVARAHQQEAEAAETALALETGAAVREGYARHLNAARTADLFRDRLLRLCEQTVRVAVAEYQAGRGGFAEMLESVLGLLDARIDYAKARAETVTVDADLARVVGIGGLYAAE